MPSWMPEVFWIGVMVESLSVFEFVSFSDMGGMGRRNERL